MNPASGERFFRLGLTGGIASGKSSVAKVLSGLGCGIADADECAREIVAPGTEGLSRIREAFGDEVIARDGALDREAMRRVVFADPSKRLLLESITHPLIYFEITRCLERFEREGRPAGILEAALLFETAPVFNLDAIMVVISGRERQRARLAARDNWTDAEIDGVLAAQMTDEERIEKADYVIENFGTLGQLDASVKALWQRLREEFR